eukprot:Lithocolla_globosa_v1_NODE_790_length_3277_cov_7.226257.p2 type:complete len:108 gc:universal NODE_790_length_3277_cov_7.226257:2842-3165(+)
MPLTNKLRKQPARPTPIRLCLISLTAMIPKLVRKVHSCRVDRNNVSPLRVLLFVTPSYYCWTKLRLRWIPRVRKWYKRRWKRPRREEQRLLLHIACRPFAQLTQLLW